MTRTQEIWGFVIAAASLLAIVAGIKKSSIELGVWILAPFRLVAFFVRLPGTLKLILEKLSNIEHEVHPNGGASLKDSSLRMEQALAEMRENAQVRDLMQRALVSQSSENEWWANAAGDATAVTAGFTNITGLSLEESRDHGWFHSVHDEHRDAVRREWHLAKQAHETFVVTCIFQNETAKACTRAKIVGAPLRSRSKPDRILGWHFTMKLQPPVPPLVSIKG